MTPWRCAAATLLLALVLSGAAPQSPGYAAYERANALFASQKLPEALAATEEALRLDPKLVPALTLKAKLAMAAYRYDVARRCLEQALAIDPRAQYAKFLYGLEACLGDNLQPGPGEKPRYPGSTGLPTTEDHAVIALLPALEANRWVLILAGTTTLGTQAAAEFVCRPGTLESLVSRLHLSDPAHPVPFEAVIRAEIRGSVPVRTEIVALHVRRRP